LSAEAGFRRRRRKMDDYSASDMRCSDRSESQLKAQFHLTDVSTRANPYTLTKVTSFNQPQPIFHGSRGEGEIIRQQCAAILFDELRALSGLFAMSGPYKPLIKQMIPHIQKANGAPFRYMLLDRALKDHILSDSTPNSSRLRLAGLLKNILTRNISITRQRIKMNCENRFFEGNSPLTDKGKINWRLKNIDVLKEKYDIPKPSSSGYFTVIF
ncbi:DUF3289 family protein, partial [Salmonella enterica]|nr:DUF3289 family protein [Salmonella enterica]ECH9657408.1 DUF3289 family protein [Salmonella enterica subsp. arizonae]